MIDIDKLLVAETQGKFE